MAKNAVHNLIVRILARQTSHSRAPRLQTASRWIATIAYSILALGIPLPTPSGKTSKEIYPCMNHHCGCQSAEECWRSCCCMTLEERLIWARENHVRPPDYVLAEARAKGIEWAAYWPSEENHQQSIQCVVVRPAAEGAACQQASGQCSCCKPVAREYTCCACERCTKAKPHESQSEGGILLMNALKCHGVGDNWQRMVVSLPPPTAFQFQFPNEVVQQINLFSQRISSISFPPDVPPPRFLIRG